LDTTVYVLFHQLPEGREELCCQGWWSRCWGNYVSIVGSRMEKRLPCLPVSLLKLEADLEDNVALTL
jgi:hypothetical protein